MANPSQAACSPWAIFLIFLRLGLTSFGGPVAHLGYFRDEFVVRRQWLCERSYADLVALCQFLPGPASSQVGIALGLSRSGYGGAIAAWMGFTLPSAIALILFALGIANYGAAVQTDVLQGVKVVAVAVVAQAVWGMGRNLCPDPSRITIMMVATCLALLAPSAIGQIGIILLAAITGLWLLKPQPLDNHGPLPISVGRREGIFWLTLFFALLLSLPLLAEHTTSHTLSLVDAFYRAGSLVFGGGHVVLPLLQAEIVPQGWVETNAFLAGYGAAQAVPGPLFTFSAFLGASMNQAPTAWLGAMICLVAIFLPSFLLVFGALPFWESLRRNTSMRAALQGINAAVVGLLLAALYQPVWTNAIHDAQDFCLALAALVALIFWRLPPWLVVLGSGFLGGILRII